MRILFILFFAYILSFASIGQIVLKNGNVYIKRADLKIAAKNGSAIEKSDIVITDKTGRAQIKFEDGTVITIGTATTFKIEEYFNDNKSPRAKFKFLRGTFKSITGKIGHIAPRNFKLQTKTATIGIRGTIVLGKTGPKGDIIACLRGLIAVKAIGVPKVVIVKPGHFTGVKPGTPPSPPKALTPKTMKQLSSSLKVTKNKKESKSKTRKKNKSDSKKQAQKNRQEQEKQPQQNNMDLSNTTTVPKAVNEALSKNKNDKKTQTVEKVVEEVKETCPKGTTGTYPDCGTCTEDQIGTYPNCISKPPSLIDINSTDCSELITGVEPNCTIASETLYGRLVFVGDNNTTLTGYKIYQSSVSEIQEPPAMDTILPITDINNSEPFNYANRWIESDAGIGNDYVSWGYWEKDPAEDSTLSNEGNFWVAGKDAQKANEYVTSLITRTNHTNYIYNGSVLGIVKNGRGETYEIDTQTNNAVKLDFDFGGGAGALKRGSYIKFQTKENTPQSWKIDIKGSLTGGSFDITNTNNIKVNNTTYDGSSASKISSSNIKGSFYGDKAQAAGGVFKAKIPERTAIGVFKAKRNIGGAE